MPYLEIKSRYYPYSVVVSGNYPSIRDLAQTHKRNLTGAVLSRIDLRYANLRIASLQGADLLGSDLSYATLHAADLRDSDLCGADLSYVNLSFALLRLAVLSSTNLTGAYLKCISYEYAAMPSAYVMLDGIKHLIDADIISLLRAAPDITTHKHMWEIVDRDPSILNAIRAVLDAGQDIYEALPWLFQD